MNALTLPRPAAAAPGPAAVLLSKVPEATALFWCIKVLTTGMGECLSDTLVNWFGHPAELGAFVALAGALVWQFRQDRFRVWPYWTAVCMVAIFGTMIADAPHKDLGWTWPHITEILAVVLVAVFAAWYATERTLSIHSITNRRREAFYWATVMATFALGTAIGDLCATTLHTGFLHAGIGFLLAMLLPYAAWRFLGLNAVVAFWSSYVLTRPLGASFSDWAWVPKAAGGLNLGKENVAVMLVPVFVALVIYAARTRNGEPRAATLTAA